MKFSYLDVFFITFLLTKKVIEVVCILSSSRLPPKEVWTSCCMTSLAPRLSLPPLPSSATWGFLRFSLQQTSPPKSAAGCSSSSAQPSTCFLREMAACMQPRWIAWVLIVIVALLQVKVVRSMRARKQSSTVNQIQAASIEFHLLRGITVQGTCDTERQQIINRSTIMAIGTMRKSTLSEQA